MSGIGIHLVAANGEPGLGPDSIRVAHIGKQFSVPQGEKGGGAYPVGMTDIRKQSFHLKPPDAVVNLSSITDEQR
jgi:hypothetical protein